MKNFVVFAVLLLMAAVAPTLSAQAPTTIQQSPTLLAPCSTMNATAGINTQVTLTLTPPNGQYVYLCGWDVTVAQDGTSTVNTNLTFTSSNLGGWLYKYSLAATPNAVASQAFFFNIPVKSVTPGTAVTLVSPANKANTTFSINAYYYYAP